MKQYPCIVADSICESRILSAMWGYFHEYGIQQLNEQKKLAQWAERITECRNSGLTVNIWCKENGVGEQSYYKWQKRVFAMVKAQTETQFAAVTPLSAERNDLQIAVTVQTAGITADIHNGADPVTVEAVLRILKLC